MKTLIVFMVLCLLLVGCSSSRKYWTKENYDPDQYRKDDFFCQQQGRLGAYKSDGIWYAINKNEIYKQCMYSLGYFIAEEKKKGGGPEFGGAGWKLLDSNEKSSGYYDAQKITRPSKNIVTVWVKVNFTKKGIIDYVGDSGEKYENLSNCIILNEINCVEKMTHSLSRTCYDNKGEVIYSSHSPSEWSFIIPESRGESLYKEVCK